MFKGDAEDNSLHDGHDHLNETTVNKGRPPFPYIFMNPWHASIEILNCRFVFKQDPEQVDQVRKTGQKLV